MSGSTHLQRATYGELRDVEELGVSGEADPSLALITLGQTVREILGVECLVRVNASSNVLRMVNCATLRGWG